MSLNKYIENIECIFILISEGDEGSNEPKNKNIFYRWIR